MFRLTSTIALMLSVLVCSAQNDSSSSVNIDESLIYIASRGSGFNLYTFDLERQKEESFTTAPGWEWAPQFISSEQIVVYNSQDTSGNFNMLVADMSGASVDLTLPALPNIKVSPNGKWISFTRPSSGHQQIKLAPIRSLVDSTRITTDTAYHGRVAWSPDSRNIAYISDKSGSNEIYTYNLDEQSTKRLTTNELREKYLSWSPDGLRLATTMRTDSTENDIMIIDTHSGEVSALTTTAINESEIAWSPSGKYIAYHAQVLGKDDIFLIEIASRQVIPITEGNGYHGEPAWIWGKRK